MDRVTLHNFDLGNSRRKGIDVISWFYEHEILTLNLGCLSCCVLATEIFDVLENELPADFERRHGLSWNLLKASLGKKAGKDLVNVW